jgi:hypothetical protein
MAKRAGKIPGWLEPGSRVIALLDSAKMVKMSPAAPLNTGERR